MSKINKTLFAGAAMVALVGAGPAQAVDLFTPDDGPSAPIWSSIYIGGHLGYGNANHDLSLNEYFKDYCEGVQEQDGPVPYWHTPETGFEDLDVNGSGRGYYNSDLWKTVDNKIAAFDGISGSTCETLARDSQGWGNFEAGSHYTVPGESRQLANIDGLNSHGLVGGFDIGADQQLGDWVIGVFGRYTLSGMETNGSALPDAYLNIEKGDEWTIAARLGHLVGPRTLLYGLVGYSQTDYDFTLTKGGETETENVSFSGLTVGGGLEYAMSQRVSLGIEGTHTFYGEETVFDEYDSDLNHGINLEDNLSETKILGTLRIKLNTF